MEVLEFPVVMFVLSPVVLPTFSDEVSIFASFVLLHKA
jgi:hypothetical protein